MMNLIEKVGNIKVYTECFTDGSIEVHFYNGSDTELGCDHSNWLS